MAGSLTLALLCSTQLATAQEALPPVNVNPPAQTRPRITRPTATRPPTAAVRTRAARRPAAAPRARAATVAPAAAPAAPPSAFPSVGPERADGQVNGFVATRTTGGSKTDTPLLEQPQAVTVIGAEQIAVQKAQTVGEATRYAPGIKSETFGNDTRNDFFLIRGFNASQTGYYLDNLQLFSTSFATFKVEPFGLDRLEVLRGPSSVLYGGSNPGGLLNAVTKKPPTDPLHYVEFGINNFGRAYGAFDMGGPVFDPNATPADGKFYYRMTGLIGAGGTQTDFVQNDRIYIAPAITYKPDEATTLTLQASYTRDKTNLENFLPYNGTVVPGAFGGRISTKLFTGDRGVDNFTREQAFAGYQFEHKFDNDVTFRQNFRYSHLDVNFNTVYAYGYSSEAAGNLARLSFLTRPRADIFNVDNQLEYKFATGFLTHTLLGGIDYRHYRLNDNQATNFSASPYIPTSDLNVLTGYAAPNVALTKASGRYINSRFTQEQLGFYLQDQIRYDRFTLALSGRYDKVNTNTENYLDSTLSKQGEEGRFSGRAGLIYTSDIGIAPYAAYSNSFNPQVGLNTVSNRPLTAETGEQVEVGVKYQPQGSQSYVSVAAFDLRRQNVLSSYTNSAGVITSTQTGEVRSTGMEFEAVANLMRGLNLVGAYTVYDLETVKDLDPANIGKRPINTPERFGGLFLDYTIPDGTFQGLGFGGGVRFVGRSFADTANDYRVPSFTLGDAQIHYEKAGWRLALNVTNIADDVYVASCAGTGACYYGERRRFTGSISYKW